MRYELRAINPRTSQERMISVDLTDDQVAAAHSTSDWMWFIQQRAWPRLPVGFMFITSAVKPVASA